MIDSYVIIKSKDNDYDDENNAQNKDKNKKIITIKKTTTKTNTITTNKTLITDKTLTGEERKKSLFITSKLWKDYFV